MSTRGWSWNCPLLLSTFLSSLLLSVPILGQSSCSSTISAGYPAPSVARGYSARIVANSLTKPRGIIFDSGNHLLVVESGKGITALTLTDSGGNCLSVSKSQTVIDDQTLNHGIELSANGRTLYASSSDKVYSWAYDPVNARNTSGPKTLVQGMDNNDHTTRTLLLSRKVSNTLLVSRGSTSNIDLLAQNISSGHSQIRSFDLGQSAGPFDYSTSGTLLGWGLRNSVGVAEDPITGGIWSVENSVDNIQREGEDIHENNPGEELNFHGYLNGTKSSVPTGSNFGYPYCYAVWNVTEIPQNSGLQVGKQFAMGQQNATLNDTTCAKDTVAPRLTFPAHWAPLDIKFNSRGTVAYITSHGSWNRNIPSGYLLYAVAFNGRGEPTAQSSSIAAVVPLLSNADVTKCPSGCFRPVGLAWDSKGRLFMSSDLTGEVYVVGKDNGGAVDGKTLDGVPTATGTGGAGATSRAAAVASIGGLSNWGIVVALIAVLGLIVGLI